MRVLLCDTETSGLSYDEGARVIEVAAALFDTKYASVIESFSALIRHDKNEAEHINGIPVGLLVEQGDESAPVWHRFLEMGEQAECYCAYNASFDQGFVSKSVEQISLENWDPIKPWVCAMGDIAWPVGSDSNSLVATGLAMGLGVASAHRASADVELMARCLARAAEILRARNLEAVVRGHARSDADVLYPLFRLGMRPKVRVVAMVPFEMKHLAKQARFNWDDRRREWWKMIPREDIAKLSFRAVERP